MKANEDIRNAISDAGLNHWQIAVAYGINDSNFCRLLRTELPESKKKVILEIISDLRDGKQPKNYRIDQSCNDTQVIEDNTSREVCFQIRLKYLVVFNRISYRKVALAIGISPQHMSNIVRGKSKPSLTLLCKIADYFNITVDYLLGREAK